MSHGVAVSACDGNNEVEMLLNHADAGLYAAKGRAGTHRALPPAVKKRRRARRRARFGERSATLSFMKPRVAWLVTGLFLAVLIAVVVLSYSPRTLHICRASFRCTDCTDRSLSAR